MIAALDHPAIVPIYDYGRHGDWPERWLFFVMPVLPGRTLHALLRERGLEREEFLEIFVRVAEALDYSASQKSSTATSSRKTSWWRGATARAPSTACG